MELNFYSDIRLHGVYRGQYFFFTLSVIFYKAGLLSSNAVGVHSVSTRFESRECCWISSFQFVCGHPQAQEAKPSLCVSYATPDFSQIFSDSLFTSHMQYIFYDSNDSVTKPPVERNFILFLHRNEFISSFIFSPLPPPPSLSSLNTRDRWKNHVVWRYKILNFAHRMCLCVSRNS